MKPVRAALLIVLFVPLANLWAQDSAPYVTRLVAQAGPTSVLLTWTDAEDYPGAQYEIWRADKEIVKDSLSQAKLLATVAAGTEAYEDTTAKVPSFYAVLLKTAAGDRKGYYIPFRNKTTAGVKPESDLAAVTAKVRVGEVAYANPQLLVSFTSLPADRKLVVFRRAGPIGGLADLKDATLLGSTVGSQSPWKDKPEPGLEFYYAVLDAKAYADGKADAFTAENATNRPAGFPLVTVPADAPAAGLDPRLTPEVAGVSRALPLPRLRIGSEPDSGATLATSFDPILPQALTPSADAALSRWSKGTAPRQSELPAASVLPEERAATQDGAGRYLVKIQKAYLEAKDWKGAAGALTTVLKLPLDHRTESRARFYLGEAWAYQRDYRRAFVEFLSARDDYPAETQPYLEALFSLLDAAQE